MKEIDGITWDVSWRDREQWHRALEMFSGLFHTDSSHHAAARQAAGRVRELIDAVDPFIQKQTAVICPHCTHVCCTDRHGSFDLHDLAYAFCLNLPIPHYDHHRKATDPCQFLTAAGCRLPRHERPFRCTWYVCETLIQHMQTLPAKQVRAFHSRFQELQRTRSEMLRLIKIASTQKTERKISSAPSMRSSAC